MLNFLNIVLCSFLVPSKVSEEQLDITHIQSQRSFIQSELVQGYNLLKQDDISFSMILSESKFALIALLLAVFNISFYSGFLMV